MVFSSDAALDSNTDQDASDPAANESMNDAYGADLLHKLAFVDAKAAAAQHQHTSMRVQARALYRKSAMYQARNLSTNICIISAPVLFCIFLLLLKAGMQQLMSGDEFKVRALLFIADRTPVPACNCHSRAGPAASSVSCTTCTAPCQHNLGEPAPVP
jgi:hypothetical protein